MPRKKTAAATASPTLPAVLGREDGLDLFEQGLDIDIPVEGDDLAEEIAAKEAEKGKKGRVKKANQVKVLTMDLAKFVVTVRGVSPLIVNNFSNKAKAQIRDKQQNKATRAKGPKDPVLCFKESLYPMPDFPIPEDPEKEPGQYGIPATAFKGALVSATKFTQKAFTTNLIRGAVHIDAPAGSPLLPMRYTLLRLREDTVRIPVSGSADLRYRGEYEEWEVDLPITINKSVISAEQVVNLLNIAGFSVGIGEWRPERNGPYGRFEVALNGPQIPEAALQPKKRGRKKA